MLLPRPVLHGIYITCFLSRFERGVVVSAPEVAHAMRLPPQQTAKILRALAAARLIAVQRGRQGGYTLARPLSEINLAQMFDALGEPDGREPADFRYCVVAPPQVCSVGCGLDRLQKEFRALLQRVTMATLAGRPCSKRLLANAGVLALPVDAG